MDGRDHRFPAGVEHVVDALSKRQTRTIGAEAADVGARDEAAAGADQYYGLDRGIGVGMRKAVLDAFRDTRAERIHRRIVDRDDADDALAFQADR